MEKQIDITKKTITELKAMAFDTIGIINFHQNNLQVLNEELAKRPKEVVEPEVEPA